jgi:SHS2 domain-containing protein
MSGYRMLEHMTDAEIEAYGETLEQAFENSALALENTMVDVSSIKKLKREKIAVKGEDLESLLYSWLEALVNRQDIDGMLYSEAKCTISRTGEKKYRLQAIVAGEKFDPKIHEQKTAIKAPTYHDMKIEQRQGSVTIRFLLDL